MVTKVLFVDTSALLKLHKKERGSDVVKWLLSPNTKITKQLHFVINSRVCFELEKKLREFSRNDILTQKYTDLAIKQFNRFYKNKYYRVVGQNLISNTKTEQLLPDILLELNLTVGKNDWDGEIYRSIVNALAYLGGKSKPILVSCDKRFYSKVKRKGYKVIDPSRQSIQQIRNEIA